jgi:hypothetical protein
MNRHPLNSTAVAEYDSRRLNRSFVSWRAEPKRRACKRKEEKVESRKRQDVRDEPRKGPKEWDTPPCRR